MVEEKYGEKHFISNPAGRHNVQIDKHIQQLDEDLKRFEEGASEFASPKCKAHTLSLSATILNTLLPSFSPF